MSFQNLPFQVATVDGRNFNLLANIYFTAKDGKRYCIPTGASSDGASTPPEIWTLMPPFGRYWPAAFLHDAAYRNTLLMWNGSAWVKAELPKAICDDLLKEAMESLGVGFAEREAIYEGVVLGGKSSFDSDRVGEISPDRAGQKSPVPIL